MSATTLPAPDDADLLHRARQRAGARMGFRIHLLAFLAVNLMLVAIALSQGRELARLRDPAGRRSADAGKSTLQPGCPVE